MVYNTDVWTDKVYKEDANSTVKDPIKWELTIWNTSELNKITGDIANSTTNNENNISKKVTSNKEDTQKQYDNYISSNQKEYWSWKISSTQWDAWLWTAMEITSEASNAFSENIDKWFIESSWLADKVWYAVWEQYNQYQDFVNNVYLWDVSYDTIKNNTVLSSRLDWITNNYDNIDNKEAYKILNKYWDKSYEMLNLYSMLKNHNVNPDINDLEALNTEVKDQLSNVYNTITNDNIFSDFMDWIKETTNIWQLYTYLGSDKINKNVANSVAKDIIYSTWLTPNRWILWKAAYWLWAIWWNIAEIVWYTMLLETWVWAAWWASKLALYSKIFKWWSSIADMAKMSTKLNAIRNLSMFKAISWESSLFKNQLFKYYAKQWMLFGTVNMAHSSINEWLAWHNVSKWDMVQYFLEWLWYWIAWELWALKTMQNVRWVKWYVAAIWASVGVNTAIDYAVNWKIDMWSMLSNIAFWFLDVHFASKSSTGLIKSMDLNNKIIDNWKEVLSKNKIDQPTISITKQQVKDIIKNCL